MIAFANPLLLFGLAGLFLPLLAHLIHQRTTERVLFPSIRFIEPSWIPQRGRRTPRDIFLLLLRMSILSGIVLAMAGMRWTPPQADGAAAKTETVFLLDLSASMAGWGSLEEAREKMLEELAGLNGRAGLVAFAGNIVRVFPLGAEPEELIRYIKAVQPEQTAGQPGPAIERALALFTERAAERTLQLYSDFQLTDWQDVPVMRLERGMQVAVHPVGAARDGNLTIQAAQVSPGYQNDLRVTVSLKNDASTDAHAELTLLAGATVKKQSVQLPAGEFSQAQFSIAPQTEGSRIVLESVDAYAPDNEYHFWTVPPPARRVALIEAEQTDEQTREELLFFNAALNSAPANQWKAFAVERVKPDALDPATLAEYAAVVYPGAAGTALAQLAPLLREYVRAGGTALFTLGEPVTEAIRTLARNELIAFEYRGMPGRARDQLEPFRIARVAEDSSLARIFAGAPMKDLLLTHFYQYLSVRPDAAAQVLIELQGGDPLLLEQDVQNGRIVFCAVRCTTGWSDLPLRSGFLPLIQETLSSPRQERRDWPLLNVGGALETNGQTFAATVAGTFRVAEQYLAVNVSRKESWPGVLRRPQIDALFERRIETAQTAAQTRQSNTAGVPLWPWLIAGAIILYAVESLLSRPRAAAAAKTVTEAVHA